MSVGDIESLTYSCLCMAIRGPFRLLQELHFSEWEFSIYFVGYCDEADIPSETKERTRWCFQQVQYDKEFRGV